MTKTSDAKPHSRRFSRLARASIAPLLVLAALMSWAVASPVGASPDDDFHLASIWCGQGERENLCEQGDSAKERRIPTAISESTCYAFDPDTSAACQTKGSADGADELTSTARGNFFAGDYPPLYFFVTSFLASEDVAQSVLLIRVFNTLVFLALAGTLYLLLPFHRRQTLVWGFAISAVPLGMFLIPSTNPSSWAITSASTLWLSLLGFLETSGRRKLALGIVAIIATAIGVGARADSAIYSVLAVCAVTALAFRRQSASLAAFLLPVSVVAISLFAFFSSNQSSFAVTGLPNDAEPVTGSQSLYLLAHNLLNIPALWAGAFGTWGLGWFDTAVPGIVWVFSLGVFCAVAFSGLAKGDGGKATALIGVTVALWLFPAYILLQSSTEVGDQVQPRYLLPMIILLGGVALFQRAGATPTLSRVQTLAALLALTIANSVALYANIRRYVTGVDIRIWNLDSRAEWWWGLPASPMTVWLIGSLTFAGALFFLVAERLTPRFRQAISTARPAAVESTH